MPLWGSRNQANNAPKFAVVSHPGAKGTKVTGANAYANTQSGAIVKGQVVSVVGANATVIQAAEPVGQHQGWVETSYGTGPVVSLRINAGGTAYTNSDTIKVTGTGSGVVNATANLVTNSTGGITSTANLVGGSGFTNAAAATLTITTSTGSAANIVPVLGGKAGRRNIETLVALKITT